MGKSLFKSTRLNHSQPQMSVGNYFLFLSSSFCELKFSFCGGAFVWTKNTESRSRCQVGKISRLKFGLDDDNDRLTDCLLALLEDWLCPCE